VKGIIYFDVPISVCDNMSFIGVKSLMAIILSPICTINTLHLQLRPLRHTRFQGDICLGPPWIVRRTTLSWIGLKPRFALLEERVDTFEVEGLNIHFVGLFSEKPDAIPILLIHGWPGKLT
jgi:hypothetical protein